MPSSVRVTFTPRLAYALITLFVLSFGALSVRYYGSVKAELTDAVIARRAAVARLAAALLAERLDRAVDIAVSLATRVRFAELVAAGDWPAAIAILRRAPGEFPFVERLFLADVSGTLMADVPELAGSRGQNFAERDWYRGVSGEWKPHVSTVYQRAAEPRINVIAVATPVRDLRNGRVAGILVLQLSLEVLFDQIREVGLDSDAVLSAVDRQGRAGYRSGVPVQAPIADLSAHPAVRELQRGRSGAEIDVNSAPGAQLLNAFDPAKYGWGVIVEQPAVTAFAARDRQLGFILLAFVLITLFLISVAWLGVRTGKERQRIVAERTFRAQLEYQVAELKRAQETLARQAERLKIVHEIDGAIIAAVKPEAIAAAVLKPLRELLGVPRAIVNMIDSASGEVEWLAAAGRRRVRAGPGVRFSSRMMGDVEALRRGEPQRIETRALPPGPEVEALLASGVHFYMAVPMIAGGELIGALSFGGEQDAFPPEQVEIAQEVATQLAIAIAHARLFESVRRHAEELEARVRERTVQLEAANKELEGFAYSVSHDLRAPLRAVDGFARMLQEDQAERLDAEGRRLLDVVRANSRQMGQLIDDLLAFSKLSRQEPAKRSVDMAALVREVIGGLNGTALPRIETLSLPPAEADRALLKQVWLNLVDNAIKYSGKRQDARIEIGGRQEAGENLYWVRDNGVGFDMRYAAKLFGVFQRLHGAHDFPGTGVGLAIVQRVVSRHGGRVWAEARPDEGACFYFTLPGAA
jgi:signal transduction histidine kinase